MGSSREGCYIPRLGSMARGSSPAAVLLTPGRSNPSSVNLPSERSERRGKGSLFPFPPPRLSPTTSPPMARDSSPLVRRFEVLLPPRHPFVVSKPNECIEPRRRPCTHVLLACEREGDVPSLLLKTLSKHEW